MEAVQLSLSGQMTWTTLEDVPDGLSAALSLDTVMELTSGRKDTSETATERAMVPHFQAMSSGRRQPQLLKEKLR